MAKKNGKKRKSAKEGMNTKPRHPPFSRSETTPRSDEHNGSIETLRRQSIEDRPIDAVHYDEALMERARAQWQSGDWDGLAQISRGNIQHHPDRANLALLIAVGHLQRGAITEGDRFVRLARDWGCGKELVGRTLIAGVHNSLGRAAALGNRQEVALHHFEASLADGTSANNSRSRIQARVERQMAQLRSVSEGVGRQKILEAASIPSNAPDPARQAIQKSPPRYSRTTYEYYQALSARPGAMEMPPFIMLDSKSLPRAGLHYMKNTFSKLLGENFSFCEWYQEPGCCRRMPCKLTGYAEHCVKRNVAALRLVKSHDFDLDDPVFETSPTLRRVILIRSPLHMLTSWFALEQMHANQDVLQNVGIKMEKIWLLHEPQVVSSAYEAINQAFRPPTSEMLAKWLEEKVRYITGFLDKWVTSESGSGLGQVIRYEEINTFIADVLTGLREHLPEDARLRIDAFNRGKSIRFQARDNPFFLPSKQLSVYLSNNADAFREATTEIYRIVPDKLFQI